MTWSSNPSHFKQVIERALTDRQRKMVIDALTSVVMQSPVDTGQYRASHRVSVGRPDNTYDQNNYDKSGRSTISKGTGQVQQLVPYTTVFIQTNCPYAKKIEYGMFTEKPSTPKTKNGYSKQAPQGVYGLTIELIKEKYR